MITIKELDSVVFIKNCKRTTNCPFCKKEIIFYGTPPIRCGWCREEILNFLSLLHNRVYRANYHNGFVEDTGHSKETSRSKEKC